MDAVLGRKKRCCCGLLRLEESLRFLTYVIIAVNFYYLAIWTLIYIKLIFQDDINYEWLSKMPPYNSLNDTLVGINFVIVFLPVQVFLIATMYAGIVWIKHRKDKRDRNAFVRFYRFSMVYYISMIIQYSMFTIMAGKVMTSDAQVFAWCSVALAIFCLIIISWHMSYIDMQHYKMNRLTMSIKARVQGAMRQLALDALLVEEAKKQKLFTPEDAQEMGAGSLAGSLYAQSLPYAQEGQEEDIINGGSMYSQASQYLQEVEANKQSLPKSQNLPAIIVEANSEDGSDHEDNNASIASINN